MCPVKRGAAQKGTRFSSTPSRAAFLFTQKITHFLALFMCQLRREKHLLNDFLSGFLRQKCCVCLFKVCCLETCHCHEASRFLLSASSSCTLRGYVRHQLSCLQQLRWLRPGQACTEGSSKPEKSMGKKKQVLLFGTQKEDCFL